MSIIWRSKNEVVTKQISDFTPIWSSLKKLFMIFLVSQQQQAPKTQKWHPQVSFSGGWKNYVLEKKGTFPTLVKCYGKTVESPVSDHGGLFVKEVRIHLFFLKRMYFFTLWKRSYDIFTVVPCCRSNVFVCTDRRTKREDTMRLREVKNDGKL